MFGPQSFLDPITLIILGALVLCLVLWGIFTARRKPEPALREAPPPPPVRTPPPTASLPETTTASLLGPGPFPRPPTETALLDSRIVVPTEVLLLWRGMAQDVEEYAVRIDTVSHDQLVFGGLVRNAQAPLAESRVERRLFHTMVLPHESLLGLRTRAGTPISNVRAWLRDLPDAPAV